MPKTKDKKEKNFVMLEIIGGPAGDCVRLNDYCICGPKPWGGERILHKWRVDRRYIKAAIE